jgi:hypothetical protein
MNRGIRFCFLLLRYELWVAFVASHCGCDHMIRYQIRPHLNETGKIPPSVPSPTFYIDEHPQVQAKAKLQLYDDFVTTRLTNKEDLELEQSFELKLVEG